MHSRGRAWYKALRCAAVVFGEIEAFLDGVGSHHARKAAFGFGFHLIDDVQHDRCLPIGVLIQLNLCADT